MLLEKKQSIFRKVFSLLLEKSRVFSFGLSGVKADSTPY